MGGNFTFPGCEEYVAVMLFSLAKSKGNNFYAVSFL
jgi:hypothetical protein